MGSSVSRALRKLKRRREIEQASSPLAAGALLLPWFHGAPFVPEPEQLPERRRISRAFWSSPRRSGWRVPLKWTGPTISLS